MQAAPVYRLEVGAAVFAAAYIATTALALALNNRAFSEISTSGVKARSIIDTQDHALLAQQTRVERLSELLEAWNADLRGGEDPS